MSLNQFKTLDNFLKPSVADPDYDLAWPIQAIGKFHRAVHPLHRQPSSPIPELPTPGQSCERLI
ncbi:hypothetical protein Lepto7375DRAFT_1500 [Leptolyngbya sp. PCC 7375]|nr:hypothetical protein Lepto7375DRAFT_1500 [Leptolyngbya sp. PCC 7375]